MTRLERLEMAVKRYVAEVEHFFGAGHDNHVEAQDHTDNVLTDAKADPKAGETAEPEVPLSKEDDTSTKGAQMGEDAGKPLVNENNTPAAGQ